jgi:transcriptional regulator with XRE-family HTH domain
VTRTDEETQLLQQFGANVRDLRVRAGITQEVLAERSGLHRTYVGSLERGERNVSLLNIYVLASALGCRPASLFDDGDTSQRTRQSGGNERP